MFMMFDDQKVKLLGVGRSISYGRSVFPGKIDPGETLRGGDEFSTVGSVFTSRSARTAGTKIALRFPRLFVCLFVCLSVCASALITCAIYYVIRYYATAVYSSFWRFAGQATANEGSFVLPRWRKRGR